MALSANREVDHFVDQELRSYGVAASTIIYKGALLEFSAGGHVQPASGAGQFAGIAYEQGDNSSGSAGSLSVRVYTLGDFGLPLAGAAVADVGRAIYTSADDTLTFDPQDAVFVGYAQGFVSTGNVIVRLDLGGSSKTVGISHQSSTFAVAAGQTGATFTNLGAGGAVTATLPQNPPKGSSYQFVCMADQELRVAPGAAGGVYVKGAKQADNKYVSITDIGDFLHVVADGNGDWVAVASIGGADVDISIQA